MKIQLFLLHIRATNFPMYIFWGGWKHAGVWKIEHTLFVSVMCILNLKKIAHTGDTESFEVCE